MGVLGSPYPRSCITPILCCRGRRARERAEVYQPRLFPLRPYGLSRGFLHALPLAGNAHLCDPETRVVGVVAVVCGKVKRSCPPDPEGYAAADLKGLAALSDLGYKGVTGQILRRIGVSRVILSVATRFTVCGVLPGSLPAM